MSNETKTLRGPGDLKLILDASQIFPDDPGQGTPAIVEGPNGTSSTYWCACGTGELLGSGNAYHEITAEQSDWLYKQEEAVSDFLKRNGG